MKISPSLLTYKNLLIGVALTACIYGAIMCLLVLFPPAAVDPDSSDTQPSGTAIAAVPEQNGTAHMEDGMLRGSVSSRAMPYEEDMGGHLSESVKRVDLIILKVLAGMGVESGTIELESVEPRHTEDGDYHFQVVHLPESVKADAFIAAMNGATGAELVDVVVTRLTDSILLVAVNGLVTHRLELAVASASADNTPETVPTTAASEQTTEMSDSLQISADAHATSATTAPQWNKTAAGDASKAKLLLIIDDFGESLGQVRSFLKLDLPMVFSVWPYATHTADVVSMVHEAGQELMLHQPMEPMGYPQVRPGEGAVMVEMTREPIIETVADNLDRVPGAIGLNNHMGSRLTQYSKQVQAVLSVVQNRKLLALDSVTHPKTVLAKEARKLGMPYLKRDIFLDVVRDVNGIVHQMEKAERIAVSRGYAVVIGHPFPETIKALQLWKKKRDSRVEVVSVGSMRGAGSAIAGLRTLPVQ